MIGLYIYYIRHYTGCYPPKWLVIPKQVRFWNGRFGHIDKIKAIIKQKMVWPRIREKKPEGYTSGFV